MHRETWSHPLPFLASVAEAGSALRRRSDRRYDLHRDVWSYCAFVMRCREWARPHLHYTCDWWAPGRGPDGRGFGVEAKHWVSLKATREAKRWSADDAAYFGCRRMARRAAEAQERRARRKGRRKDTRKGVQRAGAGEKGLVERAARAREEGAAARAAMAPKDSDEVAGLAPVAAASLPCCGS